MRDTPRGGLLIILQDDAETPLGDETFSPRLSAPYFYWLRRQCKA